MKPEILFRRKKATDHTSADHVHRLSRELHLKDLVAMGIAAVIGAGIFGTIGKASAEGGPAVSLLFVFVAVACLFSALCYSQFASTVPAAGSAYTYAYTTFGELIAWIIGWDLIMEYAIGNIAVSISWSDYFTSFLRGFHINFPEWMSTDYFSTLRLHEEFLQNKITEASTLAHATYLNAPEIGGMKIIFDFPALLITAIITLLVYIGIKESKSAGNWLVALKIFILLLFIVTGSFYIDTDNWSPFAPNGISGVLGGIAAVFFSFIGFDAISTTAEECHEPQRDLPKAMMITLAVCTVLYVLVTLVLTGMVPYSELNVGDPLAYAFQKHTNFLEGIFAFSALIAMTSVLLVFQLGQPRIWMNMSRDGLLPPVFARIHPRFKTPSFSTLVTGIIVGIPAMFMNLNEVADLCVIGTLFAFAIVCGGILVMKEEDYANNKKRFIVPFISGRIYLSLLLLSFILLIIAKTPEYFPSLIENYKTTFPEIIFWFITFVIFIITLWKNLSFIPVTGVLINLYLMSQLGATNWIRFGVWLVIGLVIYFGYSVRKSKLSNSEQYQ